MKASDYLTIMGMSDAKRGDEVLEKFFKLMLHMPDIQPDNGTDVKDMMSFIDEIRADAIKELADPRAFAVKVFFNKNALSTPDLSSLTPDSLSGKEKDEIQYFASVMSASMNDVIKKSKYDLQLLFQRFGKKSDPDDPAQVEKVFHKIPKFILKAVILGHLGEVWENANKKLEGTPYADLMA